MKFKVGDWVYSEHYNRVGVIVIHGKQDFTFPDNIIYGIQFEEFVALRFCKPEDIKIATELDKVLYT